MMRTGRWLALVLGLLLLLPAVSCAEEAAAAGAFSLVPEGDQRMRYDGVSFSDAWPEDIAADMADFFPGERVVSGIRYRWQPLAGGPVTIVFAACGSEGPEKLIGAWYSDGKWSAQTISDCFFRPGQEFGIVMKPRHNMEGSVMAYLPAVQYDGEWFVFMPGSLGFIFDCYERERDWAEDCPDGAHLVIEIGSRDVGGKAENCLILYEWMPGRGKTEFWHGKTDLFFDTGMIDAAAFPSTVEEAFACCEPNG